MTPGVQVPQACLYRREQADAVETLIVLQLCQRTFLTQQRLTNAWGKGERIYFSIKCC